VSKRREEGNGRKEVGGRLMNVVVGGLRRKSKNGLQWKGRKAKAIRERCME
jgi:hypothetical protein